MTRVMVILTCLSYCTTFNVGRSCKEGGSGSSELCLEAPIGFEPMHRSFADCSLNHLGTAPCGGL